MNPGIRTSEHRTAGLPSGLLGSPGPVPMPSARIGYAAAEARSATGAIIAPVDYTDSSGVRWRSHVFTASGTLTFTVGGTVDYLVVAGGGSGGAGFYAGGGGAGGLRAATDFPVGPQTIAVTVGAGGVYQAVDTIKGASGSNSSFGQITALGGGGGGSRNNNGGVAGGSGGGGSRLDGLPGAGTSGQGNAGGRAYRAGGGGGGAGAAGDPASVTDSSIAGKGGDGLASTISGVSVFYGGGGGGGDATHPGGAGGLGGGGAGLGGGTAASSNGTANSGGGGGGSSGNVAGGSGGSGIVIVRYRRAG